VDRDTPVSRTPTIDDNLILLHLGFQETKKAQFSNFFLKNLLANRNFAWNHLPAVGSAGGIMVGVNCDLFEVVGWELNNSWLAWLKNKVTNFTCRITTTYGSAYEERKQ
jgi:hypothetical protein